MKTNENQTPPPTSSRADGPDAPESSPSNKTSPSTNLSQTPLSSGSGSSTLENRKSKIENSSSPRKPKSPSAVWKRNFLEALHRTASVHAACAETGVSRQTLHYARLHDEPFADKFRLATEWAYEAIEAEAIRRACRGTVKPVFYRGEKIAEITVCSDRLLEYLLKSMRPVPSPAMTTQPQPASASDPYEYTRDGHVILTPALMEQLAQDVKQYLRPQSPPAETPASKPPVPLEGRGGGGAESRGTAGGRADARSSPSNESSVALSNRDAAASGSGSSFENRNTPVQRPSGSDLGPTLREAPPKSGINRG